MSISSNIANREELKTERYRAGSYNAGLKIQNERIERLESNGRALEQSNRSLMDSCTASQIDRDKWFNRTKELEAELAKERGGEQCRGSGWGVPKFASLADLESDCPACGRTVGVEGRRLVAHGRKAP